MSCTVFCVYLSHGTVSAKSCFGKKHEKIDFTLKKEKHDASNKRQK